MGRLQRIQTASLQNTSYTYDAVGNVTSIVGPDTVSFTYDALDRLVTARNAYTEDYAYNAIGNLTSKTGVGTYGYNDAAHKHAVTTLNSTQRYWYDQNGNMTQRVEVTGTQRITYTQKWDAENRLVAVTNTVTLSVTQFMYDGDGKRVKEVEFKPGTALTRTTATIGATEVVISTTGRMTTTYYFAGSTRVALRQGSAVYYIHADHLGSASLTTDASGNKIAELRYKPYGETRYQWGNTPTDYRFTGQRSEESGLGSLYDFQARMYSPVLGRFLSADTIVPSPGNPQSLNRYSYTLNNPLKYVDPTGHAQACADGDAGGGCSRTETLGDIFRLYNTNDSQLVDDLMRGWFRANPNYPIFADSTLNESQQSEATFIKFQADAEWASEQKSIGLGQVFKIGFPAAVAGIAMGGPGLVGSQAQGAAEAMTCPGCGTENPVLLRSKGRIADKQHVENLADVGKDGVSAWCASCTGQSAGKNFWGRTVDRIRAYAAKIGLSPDMAAQYTPQYGGKGHWSLFTDAIDSNGYLSPGYADQIDGFIRNKIDPNP